MSDEELAHLIDGGTDIFNCRNCSCPNHFGNCKESCYSYIKKWLGEDVTRAYVLNNPKTYNIV